MTPPNPGLGAALRARRLELGLTPEQVSAATRIAVEHIEALEQGRYEELPAGPYAAGYVRALRDYLGVEDVPVAPPTPSFPAPRRPERATPAPPSTAPRTTSPGTTSPGTTATGDRTTTGSVAAPVAPLPWVQRLALISAMALLALVISVIVQRTSPLDRPVVLEAEPQVLTLAPLTRTRVHISVDGRAVLDDVWLEPPEVHTFNWLESARVELQAVDEVRLTWNGRRLRPQGQQKMPRTFVFVDDRRGAVRPVGTEEGR